MPIAVFYYENSPVGDKVVSSIGWTLNAWLLPFSFFFIFVFFVCIKKKYRATFFSTQRGRDLAVSRFYTCTDDASKADAIFPNNKRFWKDIEGDVEKWVKENWGTWMAEKPDWFDNNIISAIPVRMIPTDDAVNESRVDPSKTCQSIEGESVVDDDYNGKRRKSNKVAPE